LVENSVNKKHFISHFIEMHEVEMEVCEKILDALYRRPVSRLFWNNPSDISNPGIIHPYSLSWVAARLAQDCYSSPADFVRDLRICFQNGKTGSSGNTLRSGAAQQLLVDLDSLVSSYHPSSGPAVLPVSLSVAAFEESSVAPKHANLVLPSSDQPPGSLLFEHAVDPTDVTLLIRDIKLLSCPDLTAKLAVLVRTLQPEAVIVTSDVSFNIGIMSESTRVAVRQYVTDLLHDAAVGKLDPFARPFGVKFFPIRVQERGVYMRSTGSRPH
jgi:hypothetical protein